MPALVPALLALSVAAAAAAPPAAAPAGADPAGATSTSPGADAPPARPPRILLGAPPLPGDPSPQTRRYQIERIRVAGLERTRESEVRRHILLSEGELLDEERVLLSRLRLLQLGWFSRVETRVERGSARGLVVLVFQVSERNTLIVTDFILGSTEAEALYGGLGLSQQNFLGRGFGLSGAFAYGGSPSGRPQDPDRYALRGAFFVPSLDVPAVQRGLVLGASVVAIRGEEFACPDPDCSAFEGHHGDAPRVRYRRTGGEGTIGIRPGPFERVLASFRSESLEATSIGNTAAGLAPAILAGNSTLSALTGTYEMDTRDDFFFPREGLRTLFQVTFGSRLFGGDYEYSRYFLNVETAYALFGQRLRLQLAVGAAQGGAPFFERFYAADFSYFAIGPAIGRALELNFSTDPRYDAFLSMGGLEYGIPLWSTSAFFRRGYLALGVRGVYSTETLGGRRTRVSRTPVSADVALRFDTPVGVFNLSAGYLLDNFL